MQAVKRTTDDPEVLDRFNRTLAATVEAMEESGVQYAFIGGVASAGLGRPRSTHDIDVFVRPEDAEIVLRSLVKHGFKTEKRDPSWLFKAFKDDILVDIIFKSKGEIYLDQEMINRSIKAKFHGKELRLVAPEDLTIIKASAHSELCPGHWHDALALLSHANMDWDYLIRRARKAPRRVLSLLIYAHSNDIWVPKYVVEELFRDVYGDLPRAEKSRPLRGLSPVSVSPALAVQPPPSAPPHEERVSERLKPMLRVVPAAGESYTVAHLRDRLARDPRVNELDIQIEHAGDRLLLRGEVMSVGRREAVESIANECFPEMSIENQIRVMRVSEPTEEEEVR